MKIGPFETGRVHHGDCLELMKKLPDGSIPMILTDPPYGCNNNDGDLIQHWEASYGFVKNDDTQIRRRFGETVGKKMAEIACQARPIMNDGPEEMRKVVGGMLLEAGRLLKKQAAVLCCCAGGGGPQPIFAWLAQEMDKKPLKFFHAVVWDKGPLGMGWRYRRNYEFMMVAHLKRGKLLWAWEGSGMETANVVRIPRTIPRQDHHPTEKPVELMEHFLKLHTTPKDLVLDPFAGSGATGVACARMGRPFLGFELDPKWVKHANDRISAAQRGLTVKESLGGQRTVFEAMKP